MPADATREPRSRQDTPSRGPRAQIIADATTILLTRGVDSLTHDEILRAGGVNRRELERFFPDLDDLVQEIVDTRLKVVLRDQLPVLGAVHSLEDLREWRARLLERSSRDLGCQLGSLIYRLADRHHRGHCALAGSMGQWQDLLTAALDRIQAAGQLRPDVSPATLAVGVMAALQGGYLLAHTANDTEQLRVALDMALAHVSSFAV
jgi:TetR/AcrR family transcriptional repressor of nem operon